MNAPATHEGREVWRLARRLEGQMRLAPRGVVGLDMGAALAVADALGVDRALAAEMLPGVEAEMVRGVNAAVRSSASGGEVDG